MKNFRILPNALKYVIILAVITVGTLDILTISITSVILLVAILFFYRNPKRNISYHKAHILSPADGIVTDITVLKEEEFINGEGIKIRIYSSPFNVKGTRAPIDGKVSYDAYYRGRRFPFRKTEDKNNERYTLGIENEKIKVLIHEITGSILRSIFFWARKEDGMKQGNLYGYTKYGSVIEVILPKGDVDIKVNNGEQVFGGLTIIGVMKGEV